MPGGSLAGDVDLGAVARRHDDRFARRTPPGERPQRVVEAAAAEVEPLAEFDRRRAMTCANEKEVHWNQSPRTIDVTSGVASPAPKLWLSVRK